PRRRGRHRGAARLSHRSRLRAHRAEASGRRREHHARARRRLMLTIAVPKGRTLRPLTRILERAGLDPTPLSADDRRLVREDPVGGLRYLLLKPDDVPTYVEYGA